MVEKSIRVDYQSRWMEGFCDSVAMLNLSTGEVFDIEDSGEGAGYECHERDVIFTKDGTEILVEEQNGYTYAICMEDVHLFTENQPEPETYLNKLETLEIGFELRYIHSTKYSIVSKGGPAGHEVTVVGANGKEWEGKRVVVKNKPLKNNGKWRARRQSDDGSMSCWSNKHLGDTMEEALQSLYEEEIIEYIESQRKYKEAIENKLARVTL